MSTVVEKDEAGIPRNVKFTEGLSLKTEGRQSPRQRARQFLEGHPDLLSLRKDEFISLDQLLAREPSEELAGFRFETEKRVMDLAVVGYVQTYFGLPVIGAGVSVVMRSAMPTILSASSTVYHDIKVERPTKEAIGRAATVLSRDPGPLPLRDIGIELPQDGLDEKIRDSRLNAARLVIFHFEAKNRQPESQANASLQNGPFPRMPLPPLLPSIRDGSFYVALEVFFVTSVLPWGRLNWVAYIDITTNAVLQLKPLTDHATASVFVSDPITKGSGVAPSATNAQLNTLRDPVTLPGLVPPSSGAQSLAGEFVMLVDDVLPTVAVPTTNSPFDFTYDARTNNFAAANAYFHCDRFFRMVRDLGFDVATYFDGTTFPVRVDHRGFNGNFVNARCPGNATGNGIGTIEFALADLSDTANPLGISADWRVVLHELGGHGILWDHVNSPNFGFAHSAGDSFGAILNDPGTNAPDRFLTFPWVNIGRRHDRTPAAGWGWGGAHDGGGYDSEQILATTLFRMYRSIGGDSPFPERREFAARSSVYLILAGVGLLTPATNPVNAMGLEAQLEAADAGVWTSANPSETYAGGAYWKVIRWAFEKQGLFRSPGAPATEEGSPPEVDVFIDDGRHGEYPFQANHANCIDIWNRLSIADGNGVHEAPVTCRTNYAYVRIKNRGTNSATNVTVRGFHRIGAGQVFPDDWEAMTTDHLPAPDLAANDMTGVIVGPFEWVPTDGIDESMLFSVSAGGDSSNLDGRITGPIPEWRLVPHDNNLGQRDVATVKGLCIGKLGILVLAWAWIIVIGGLMITPGGVTCIACGPALSKALGVISVLTGVAGLVVTLRNRVVGSKSAKR